LFVLRALGVGWGGGWWDGCGGGVGGKRPIMCGEPFRVSSRWCPNVNGRFFRGDGAGGKAALCGAQCGRVRVRGGGFLVRVTRET